MGMTTTDYYNHRRGWDNSEIGWHEYHIRRGSRQPQQLFELYDRIVEWMYSDLPMCERHCRWMVDIDPDIEGAFVLKFKFRREQDYLLFIMKWA